MKKQPHPVIRFVLHGLAFVLPLGLTAALLIWLWNFISNTVFDRVDAGLVWLLTQTGHAESLPPALRFWLSVACILISLFLLGWWFSGFLGRRALAYFERLLGKVPLIGAIYPYIKQITEFFFGKEKKVSFEKVVMLPYPRPGIYSVGFLTGSCVQSLNAARSSELVSVFVPSSPMPATGYTLFVPIADLVPVNLTVEEALRMVISGGVLVPKQEYEEPTTLGALYKEAPSESSES